MEKREQGQVNTSCQRVNFGCTIKPKVVSKLVVRKTGEVSKH